MRAVDQCAGGRRYTLIDPATDATDATASTPRAGGQTARSAPSARASIEVHRRRACWRPACPAAARACGLPGVWAACRARGAGAALVRCMSVIRAGPIAQNSDFVQTVPQKMDVLGVKCQKMLQIAGVYGCTHPINHR